METKERCGRFVLQFEDARTSAGSFWRAVQLSPAGYEKHVQLFRSERLAQDAAQAVSSGLSEGFKVQHAQVARGLEVGQAGRTVFAAYEMFEGRSVGALLERSKRELHPFAPDHALLIVSKVAAALEGAQSRKRIHGFLIPECVHVSHDGEVSVRGFGLPARVLRQANCVGLREATFLAPEVEASTPLDIRADIFSLGAQLFEMLTGTALPRNAPTLSSIEAARIASPGTDGTPIPKALSGVLAQALAEEPERRFKDASAFKKAVDTLLFSGDYSPTTFNLAFFMHTLFRDEGDEDANILRAERAADYRPYLVPDADETLVPPPFLGGAGSREATAATTRSGEVPRPAPPAEMPRPPSGRGDASRSGRVTGPAVSAPADEPSGRVPAAEPKRLPIAAVVAVVLAVLVGGGYLLTRPGSTGSPTPTPAPTMNPAESAALARVKELEVRLAALEAEKSAAEQTAADQAKARIEAQARARGRAVDPLEVQAAQDEARKKAQSEQESRLQTERQKIEEERRLADEARAAEAARTPSPTPQPSTAPSLVAPTPTPTAMPTLTPTPQPAPAASVAPPAPQSAGAGSSDALAPSGVLDPTAPGVVAAELISQPRIDYPPMARAQKMTGSVLISALIDEQGKVIETRVIRGAPSNTGFNQAALNNVKGRKYKPATLNGKPGRTWVAIKIDFRL